MNNIILCIMAICLLSGCVPFVLPAPSEKDPTPFTKEDLEFIQPEVTKLDEVIEKIGNPITTRLNGRLTVFGKVQKTGIKAITGGIFLPIPIPYDIRSDIGEQAHLLLVSVNEKGLVTGYDVIRGENGCMSSGLCIGNATMTVNDGGEENFSIKKITNFSIVIYDKGKISPLVNARNDPNGCLVHVYQEDSFFYWQTFFSFDSEQYGITPEGFVLKNVPEGNYQISAAFFMDPNKTYNNEFECLAGEKHYIELSRIIKPKAVGIKQQPSKVGEEEISKRIFILTD